MLAFVAEGVDGVVSEDRVLELVVLCAASLCSRKMAFFERFVMSRLIYHNKHDFFFTSSLRARCTP